MARSVAERVFRPSSAEAIEADLAALWRELAQGDTPIARAVMSNLVVFRDRIASPDAAVEAVMADLPLDEVVARHPSRLIVLEHEHGRATPDAPFAAGVGIATFGPPSARYGVEQIVVRSACAEASLPSIVRRLARGDLPTSVWWTEDLAEVPPLEALVTMGRQLVYDSRDWRDVRAALHVLEPLITRHRIDLADVNWRRLAPLRRALEHAATDSQAPLVASGARVRIAHHREEAALAWLCAGAMMVFAKGAPLAPAQVEASDARDAWLVVTIETASERATVSLSGAGASMERGRAAPLNVAMAVESEADAVAAELRLLSQDKELHAALAALVQLFAARLP
jgi:glucose-6-phosphate dehydrogenase assembly protein OpcA